jgi:hypothetical protein
MYFLDRPKLLANALVCMARQLELMLFGIPVRKWKICLLAGGSPILLPEDGGLERTARVYDENLGRLLAAELPHRGFLRTASAGQVLIYFVFYFLILSACLLCRTTER